METISNIIHSQVVYFWFEGYKYEIRFNTSKTTSVNILDVSKEKPEWVLRLDGPHNGAQYHHINVNEKFTGVPDPHTKLSPTAFKAGENIAKCSKFIGKTQKVLFPLSILLDAVRLGVSTKNDYDNKTSRNTVTAIANISGSWLGSIGGVVAGAAIGSIWCPVFGTIIGSIAGSIGGSFFAAYSFDYVINFIGEKTDYDTIDAKCKNCDKTFKVRTYLGEKEKDFCIECSH